MEGSGLVVSMVILIFYFPMSDGLESCHRKCGSKTVPFPFGFSHGCPNKLNCSVDGNITIKGFQVQNITADRVLVRHEFRCEEQITELRAFQQQYALTARNILLVNNCPKLDSCCAFKVGLIPEYLSKDNDVRSCNFSEYSFLHTNGSFIKWTDLSSFNCKLLLPNIVVDKSDSLELVVDFGKLELGWWINGNCSVNSCSANADCDYFTSPNTDEPAYRCSCKPGFFGDGFPHGDGCHKDSSTCNPSRYMSGNCGGTNRIAVLIGGILGGATVVAVTVVVYCLLKRSCAALRKRRSRKRLVWENGGSSLNVPIFTYRELERATKGFSEQERVGNGAFGTVYAGKLRSDRAVAVKKIRHMDRQGIEQVMNEIKVLSCVEHPNLVRLMGWCIEKGEPILVYEYMPNGTLAQHLQRERGQGLSWNQRLNLATETACALAYLHSAISPPVYHRDVKSSNILLDYSFNSKVGDFGLSRTVLTESSHISTVPQGTPGYLDPQYHQNFHLSDKSDVYSFGVVLVEIITALKVVDFSRNKKEINLAALAIDKIGSGCVDEIIDPFLEADKDEWLRASVHMVAELAFRCLAFDRDARPTMVEVAQQLHFITCTKPPQPFALNNNNNNTLPLSLLSSDDEDNDTFYSMGAQNNSSGSRRITIQPPVIAQLNTSFPHQKTDRESPVSVQDPWVSGQSSPSTSSLLDNVIE